MNALWAVVISIGGFTLAYHVYGRYLSNRILGLDPGRRTPAHELRDDIDYIPTKKVVLFGHHFVSIAGLAPIMGPAIAVIWGWLPALLWVVLGTMLLGAVHDFSALFVSIRHQGRSVGDIAGQIIGPRGKVLFLFIIFFLLALAMGVFAIIVSDLFTNLHPEAVVPVFSLMLIAMLVGFLVYRANVSITVATTIGLLLMFFFIWLGMKYPVRLDSLVNEPQRTWIVILLFYAFFASVLPVWLLLQPRDYLNSFKLYIGVTLILVGLVIFHPKIVAPAINHQAQGLPPLFPFLFITVACGAISGFHSLVSSGTSAKQLDNERDARLIGFGGMLGEGMVATITVIACTAGVASAAVWHEHYSSWKAASGLGPQLGAFIEGAGLFLSKVGIPKDFAVAYVAVVVVAFAMTTLDSATRLLRYNVEEIGRTFRLEFLSNRFMAAFVAVVAIGYFALMRIGGQPAGLSLWQLFGTTNQLLAGLALLTVSLFLFKAGKPTIYTLIPMCFMLTVTICAMFLKIRDFWATDPRPWPILAIGVIVLVMAVWLAVEAAISYRKFTAERKTVEVGVAGGSG